MSYAVCRMQKVKSGGSSRVELKLAWYVPDLRSRVLEVEIHLESKLINRYN